MASRFLTRRDFLGATTAAALAYACGNPNEVRPPQIKVPPGPRFDKTPFQLGVASGDCLSDAVILWTRLAPSPLDGGGVSDDSVPVGFELSTDNLFRDIVKDGVVEARADEGHSLHVDVQGLKPDTWYWYRFVQGDYVSGIGRTRTLPVADAEVEKLRIGITCCQNFGDGMYTVHRHLAAEELDLVLFLGDYIYEGHGDATIRAHTTPEPVDLDGYRNRYAEYKSDPELIAAHQAFPWFVIWDDHEVRNDYAGNVYVKDDTVTDISERKRAAYRAYWEHQPLRQRPSEDGGLLLHRSLRYGKLAELFLLDTRQYRSPQRCGNQENGKPCPEWGTESDTLLGTDQRSWLFDRLAATDARWKSLVQQVVFFPMTLNDSFINFDQWDGYPAERKRVLDQAHALGMKDLVVLSGDIHAAGFAQLTSVANDPASEIVGAEIVTNSVTSGGSKNPNAFLADVLMGSDARIRYAHLERRGYTVCELRQDTWDVWFKLVDSVDTVDAPVSTAAAWRIHAGTGQLERQRI